MDIHRSAHVPSTIRKITLPASEARKMPLMTFDRESMMLLDRIRLKRTSRERRPRGVGRMSLIVDTLIVYTRLPSPQ
jgi:hypothetical protein